MKLPYDVNTIQFLNYFAHIYFLTSDDKPMGSTQFHAPGMQKFIRNTSQILQNHRAAEIKTLGLAISKLQPNVYSRHRLHIHNALEMTAAEYKDAYYESLFHLQKLPVKLLNMAALSGRNLVVTAGPITNYPDFKHLRGVTPLGWDASWDHIPGGGGGYMPTSKAVINIEKLVNGHGSRNLILHEMLHNIDIAHSDFKNQYDLSNAPQFLKMWKNTEWQNDELDYEALYPQEAFAELGAKYFDSQVSRQILLEEYPQWHEYFRKPEVEYSN